MALSTTQIQNAYVAFFNRPADVAGLTYWGSYAGSAGDLLNTFAQSAEYNALYKGMNNTQLVNAVYQNLFGRSPDVDGLNYWVNQLDSGKVTIGNAANTIQTGAQGTDKSIIDNKVAAATAFTTALDTTAEIVGYAGASSATLGQVKAWLSTVTDTSTSLEAAKTGLTALTGSLAGGTNEAGTTYVLTTNQDVLTGSTGNDNFRAVAGNTVGTQDQTTLNSSDIIDGGTGTDALIVNLVGGNYNGGARIKNIETLQIGTNDLVARTFDYNVNAGSNEVTEVTTIVADQINVGEQLTVTNILKTGSAIPTLKWDNEAGSTAGTFAATFRESAVSGDTEVKLVLDDVKARNSDPTTGRFNLGTGANASVETLRVVSQGSTANTLNASSNSDSTAGVDLVGASTDSTNDNGALKTVIVEGAQAFGKAAELVTDITETTNYGLMNRTTNGTNDLGTTAKATAANLVSLAATVTTLDASAATGDTNIRFTGRADGAEVAVTYKGGKGNDYVEFQQGNVNATGGDGNDTFAFINIQNNSTLTTADTIVGGAGTDTIQMGVNGVGSYNLETTEFNNKSGIDVLDLRGQTNTVKLSDAFVTGSDAGLTVRTDKIVQTSATNSANDSVNTSNNLQENQSVNTIDLTALAANRAVTVTGGSGSDRLLVNEVALNSSIVFDGGTNAGNNAAGTGATTGDYDTLTVVNSAVLSRGDLSNIKGIEGIVLTENVTGISSFTIELTEAFVLANTASENTTSTSIDDQVLQIVTAAAANGTALTSTDTVKIDVTDLFDSTTNVLKTSLATRKIDINGVGATVSYVYKGADISLTALQAMSSTIMSGNDATGRADVAGSGAAVTAGAATGVTFTSSAVGAQNGILGTNNNDIFNLSQSDTVNGGTGSDTVNLNAGSAAAVVTLGAGADTINVNTAIAATGGAVVTTGAASTINITADQNGDLTQEITGGFAHTYNVSANQTALTVLNTAGATINATAGGTFTLGAAGQIFTSSGANNVVVNGAAGADTITLANTGTGTVNAGTGIDTINITGATGVTTIAFNDGAGTAGIAAAANRDVVTGFSAVNDIIQLDTAQTTVTYAAVQSVNTTGALTIGTGVSSVTVLNFELGGSTNVIGTSVDGSAILANLGGAITVTANDLGYIVAYDAGNAYLYAYTDSGNTSLAANEIALIGTFNGVAVGALGTANFAEVA